MPSGKYSYAGDSEGTAWRQSSDSQRPFAISEPAHERGSWPGQTSRTTNDGDEVQAKEPDRQSTSRRGTTRARGKMAEDDEQQGTSSRSVRATSSRSGAQARRASDRTQARRTATPSAKTGRQKKSRRGFAAMSAEQQREIARKGGLTVSRNPRHMADIGRVGGEHSHGGRRARR